MSSLVDALTAIENEFRDEILPTGVAYCLIDLGKVLQQLGAHDDVASFTGINAIVPLKRVKGGMNFEVNGKELSDYAQLQSGIVVPTWVAQQTELPHKTYQPKDRMVLNMQTLPKLPKF
ncbi:MAG: hypothetical protein Q7R96_05070 [Nanoarchaeota archaeon]|nr:hypothetical protein [Nanoarchaeota archaeon]